MDGISASIVIPVYNSARYLEGCLASALGQTRGDIEVICVDNGSTDESPDILARMAAHDERLVVLRERRPGVSCARNTGMARARGDYLLFMDSDDTVEPTLVERALSAAEEQDAQLVIYSLDECYEEPRVSFPWPRCPHEECYASAFATRDLDFPAMFAVTPNVWRIAFKASYIKDLDLVYPEELRSSEDLVFVYRAMLPATRVTLVPEVLYHYRKDNAGSLTRNDRQAAGLVALQMIYDAFEGVHGERWFQYQFVNLLLDTFEYQMKTCATKREYTRLFEGFQQNWRQYVWDRSELVDERYRRFFGRMDSLDPMDNLFEQHQDAEHNAEFFRMWDGAHRAAAEQAVSRELEVTDELNGIKASRSWRFARAIAGIAGVFHR